MVSASVGTAGGQRDISVVVIVVLVLVATFSDNLILFLEESKTKYTCQNIDLMSK